MSIPEGCDFVLFAEVLQNGIKLGNDKAKKDGGELYYEPEYASAITAFLKNPSYVTAIPLSRTAPFLQKQFEECSPGGNLYELQKFIPQRQQVQDSARNLFQNPNQSSESPHLPMQGAATHWQHKDLFESRQDIQQLHDYIQNGTPASPPLRSDQFLPQELLTKSLQVIQSTNIGNIPKVVTTKQNMVSLAMMQDMLELMGATSAAFKKRVACWVGYAVTIGGGFAFDLRILLLAVPVFVFERRFAKAERLRWKLMAAVLFSLEALVNDFAGWGRAHPLSKSMAMQVLGSDRTEWLDRCLPLRSQMGDELLKYFGPSK